MEIRDPRFKDEVFEYFKNPFNPSYVGAYDSLRNYIGDMIAYSKLTVEFFEDIAKKVDEHGEALVNTIVESARRLFVCLDGFVGEWNLIYEHSEDGAREDRGEELWYSAPAKWDREITA